MAWSVVSAHEVRIIDWYDRVCVPGPDRGLAGCWVTDGNFARCRFKLQPKIINRRVSS